MSAGSNVLILAPFGRDATVLNRLLQDAGVQCTTCGSAEDLRKLAGATQLDLLLMTEEALVPTITQRLRELLEAQPSWSDLPVLLLASAVQCSLGNSRAISDLRTAGNVILLERPVRGLSLLTSVQAALRARKRQYQLRALMLKEQRARSKAEAASRLKDEFVATVSHELRTPVSAALLWTRLLAEGRLGQAESKRALELVRESAEAQSQLVEDLLDMSRIVSGTLALELDEVRLAPLVEAAIEVIRVAAAAKRINVETTIEAELIVRGDAARVRQVLWNLLSNAIKFTPAGGRVSVRLARVGQYAKIEVADSGIGIDAEFLPYVFERFRQADSGIGREEGGLGLGLAISRELVELHGGTIGAESAGAECGAKFSVALPVARPAAIACCNDQPALPSATENL